MQCYLWVTLALHSLVPVVLGLPWAGTSPSPKCSAGTMSLGWEPGPGEQRDSPAGRGSWGPVHDGEVLRYSGYFRVNHIQLSLGEPSGGKRGRWPHPAPLTHQYCTSGLPGLG